MTAQQLKNSILQMAVQGKLVPQDPNDEPASVLIQKIREEKEQLIKDGKIKKEKNPSFIFRGDDGLFYEKIGNKEPICIEDEIPFEIPDSWEWDRLGNLFFVEMGQSPKSEYVSESQVGVEFHQGKIFFGSKYLKKSNQTTIKPSKIALADSVLLCVRAPVGKVNITDREICIGRGLCAIKPLAGMSVDFTFYLLETYEDTFNKKATGTTFSAITGEVVKNQLVPVPSLNEQSRIVDKINKIIPYLESYDKADIEVKNVDHAFPNQLKKSILQMAVQGKLVSQDPNDEPASILIERIHDEKEQLVIDGKIKRDKHESVIYRRDGLYYEKVDGKERCIDDEIPFEIPDSWEWTRLATIAETNIGLTYQPSDKVSSGGTIVLRSSNIQNGQMDYSDIVQVSCQIPERSMIHSGDILICARNGSRALVGKSAIVDREGMAFGAFMAKISSPIANYLFLFLQSPVFRSQLEGVNTETINQITQNMLKKQLIPIPPYNEQLRIIDKTSLLLKKCETLK